MSVNRLEAFTAWRRTAHGIWSELVSGPTEAKTFYDAVCAVVDAADDDESQDERAHIVIFASGIHPAMGVN